MAVPVAGRGPGACQFFLPPPSEDWLAALHGLPRWTVGRLPLDPWPHPPYPPPGPRLARIRLRLDEARVEYRQNLLAAWRVLWRSDVVEEQRLLVLADAEGHWVEPSRLPAGALPSPAPGARGQGYGLRQLARGVEGSLPRWLELLGGSFRDRVRRRRQREEERLHRYYQGLEAEAAEPVRALLHQLQELQARRLLPGAGPAGLPQQAWDQLVHLRAELAQTLARLRRERQLRLEEVAERYRIGVEVQPLAAALVWVPHLVLALSLRAEPPGERDDILEVEAAWNLLQGRWTGLACQGCGREAGELTLCRCPRLLCPACARPCTCSRPFCRECAPGWCSWCDEPFCPACAGQVTLPDGAQGSCCRACSAAAEGLWAGLRPWVTSAGRSWAWASSGR